MISTKTIKIMLNGANELEIEYTPKLLEMIRNKYSFDTSYEIDASTIKSYIENELRSALSKEVDRD